MSVWSDLLGTTRAYFRLGFAGPRLKDTSGSLTVRNPGDSADADVTGAILHASGEYIEINSDAADTGTDRKLTLRKNTAASAPLTVDFPPAKGTDGYLLRQKAGTASNVVELEFVAPAGGSSAGLLAETTSLAFGASSPVTMFTQSATAVIDRIQVVIDTAFDGAPSASVGIVGTTSKYMSATDLDLTAAAETVFEVHPGKPAPGGSENLIITYSAGGASAGAARFLVYYADAPV